MMSGEYVVAVRSIRVSVPKSMVYRRGRKTYLEGSGERTNAHVTDERVVVQHEVLHSCIKPRPAAT